jgi:hypothetical protein
LPIETEIHNRKVIAIFSLRGSKDVSNNKPVALVLGFFLKYFHSDKHKDARSRQVDLLSKNSAS